MKKSKTNTPKRRNWIAVSAHFRRAGAMKNRKKAANSWRAWYEKNKSQLAWHAERRRFEIRGESKE